MVVMCINLLSFVPAETSLFSVCCHPSLSCSTGKKMDWKCYLMIFRVLVEELIFWLSVVFLEDYTKAKLLKYTYLLDKN